RAHPGTDQTDAAEKLKLEQPGLRDRAPGMEMTTDRHWAQGFAFAQAGLPERFATIALANIGCEFPHKLDQVLASSADLATPRQLHPSFHGSYDWHSCVHMHWLLARLRRAYPALASRAAVDAQLELSFAPEAIAGEVAFLGR